MTRNIRALATGTMILGICACADQQESPVQPNAPRPTQSAATVKSAKRYIVVMGERGRADGAESARDEIAGKLRGRVYHRINGVFSGFVAELDSTDLVTLSRDQRVRHLVEDVLVESDDIDLNAGWALGRIDQRTGPSDNQFSYSQLGQSSVHVYIVDSGISSSHSDFAGRLETGWSFDPSSHSPYSDCTGHGTSVASVAAGSEFGVAKHVKIHSVRVKACSELAWRGDIIAGVDWIRQNHVKPAVANISMGLWASIDGVLPGSLNNAVIALRAAGVFVAVSAGNSGVDACQWSPANAGELMTVGATTSTDAKASFTNTGHCVDIYAPGEFVSGATIGGGFYNYSGTSYSAPLVSGVAALLLAKYPTDTPNDIHYAIRDGATSFIAGAPTELLLYSNLPAPVRVSIDGPSVVPPGAICSWTAEIRAGRRPFFVSWGGFASGSSLSFTGSLLGASSAFVTVTDALGGSANALVNVSVDHSQVGYLVCP